MFATKRTRKPAENLKISDASDETDVSVSV
jgi:hypothetical protein